MTKKKKQKDKKVKVYFNCEATTGVTGSMYYVQAPQANILLECGLMQDNSILQNYKANNTRPKFKIKTLDYIFVMHNHADHALRLPFLYKHGCTAKIFVPKGFIALFEIMAKDSVHIIQKDSEYLSKTYKHNYDPIYTQEHVDLCVSYMEEYEDGIRHKTGNGIDFKFTPSGHIINAMQLELYVRMGPMKYKKIVYTSDLGNMSLHKYYSTTFKTIPYADLFIGECTYAGQKKRVPVSARHKDLEKMRTVIQETIENKGKVLIPVFALDRTQNILTYLYELFKDDPLFRTKILVDSPLAKKISELYRDKLLEGEEKELWEKVCNWNRVRFIESYEESQMWQNSRQSCVVLACSGMLVGRGRSVQWVKSIIGWKNAHILFVGYASEDSLAYRLKQGKQTRVRIEGVARSNMAKVTDLKSFSSHMQKPDLLKYYSKVNADKIVLVHGNNKEKIEFAKELEKRRSEEGKTGRVIVPTRHTVITI